MRRGQTRRPTVVNPKFGEDAPKSNSPPKSKQGSRSGSRGATSTSGIISGNLDPQKLKEINPDEWNNIPLPVCVAIKTIIEQLNNCIYTSMVFQSGISRLGQDIKQAKMDMQKEIKANGDVVMREVNTKQKEESMKIYAAINDSKLEIGQQ